MGGGSDVSPLDGFFLLLLRLIVEMTRMEKIKVVMQYRRNIIEEDLALGGGDGIGNVWRSLRSWMRKIGQISKKKNGAVLTPDL